MSEFNFSGYLANAVAPHAAGMQKGAVGPKMVFQLCMLPEIINPDEYKNALSSANPKGDLRTLFRFRELANNIPQFSRQYNPNGQFVESTFSKFLRATVKPDQTFTQSAFFDAQQTFSDSRLAPMSGISGSWRPVYAAPWNWAELLASRKSLLEMTMDMNKPYNFGPSTFQVIGSGGNDLVWNIGEDNGRTFGPTTKIRFIRYKYMKVELVRPWFDFELFQMKGWYLQGQAKGYYSSGSTDQNDGVMPMVPVSVIFATDLEIYGQVDPSDQQLIANALSQNKFVRLGNMPFVKTSFGHGASESLMQSEGFFTMAWISQLLPLAPAIDDELA